MVKRSQNLIERLKSQMIIHKVFASDLKPRNICCKILKDNSVVFVIVDGIGHRDVFPLADWFSFFSKLKIKRRFKRYLFSIKIGEKFIFL